MPTNRINLCLLLLLLFFLAKRLSLFCLMWMILSSLVSTKRGRCQINVHQRDFLMILVEFTQNTSLSWTTREKNVFYQVQGSYLQLWPLKHLPTLFIIFKVLVEHERVYSSDNPPPTRECDKERRRWRSDSLSWGDTLPALQSEDRRLFHHFYHQWPQTVGQEHPTFFTHQRIKPHSNATFIPSCTYRHLFYHPHFQHHLSHHYSPPTTLPHD